MMNLVEIGKRVHEKRYALAWSQTKLADLARLVQSDVSKIENGRHRNFTVEHAYRLAAALGVTPQWLLGENECSSSQTSQASSMPSKG